MIYREAKKIYDDVAVRNERLGKESVDAGKTCGLSSEDAKF